jgi:hypothetical protein
MSDMETDDESQPTELSPLKAIRRKCLECSGGSFSEVRICAISDCPLWPYRIGRRPSTIRASSPELLDREHIQREAAFQCLRELGTANAVLSGSYSAGLKARYPERWAEVTGQFAKDKDAEDAGIPASPKSA